MSHILKRLRLSSDSVLRLKTPLKKLDPNTGYTPYNNYGNTLPYYGPYTPGVVPGSAGDGQGGEGKGEGSGMSKGVKKGLGALVNAGATAVGGLVGNAISGGYSSDVGNMMQGLSGIASAIPGPWGAALGAGLNVVGGAVNGLFGTKTNQAALKAANEGTARLSGFTSNASSFDDVKGPEALAAVQDVYSAGIFGGRSSARRKNAELRRLRYEALLFADRSVENNVNNIANDLMSNQLANYASLGGNLDIDSPVFLPSKTPSLLNNKVSWKSEYFTKTSKPKDKIRSTKKKVQETDVTPEEFNNILANGGKVEIIDDDRLKEGDSFEFNTQEELNKFLLEHNLTEKDYIIE